MHIDYAVLAIGIVSIDRDGARIADEADMRQLSIVIGIRED